MSEALIRYAHFLGIIGLSSALILEHVLLTWDTNKEKMQRLAKVDAFFGVSALIILCAGLGLWFSGTKPSVFYSHNWIFHLKLTIFGVIALLSIYPTIFFITHRNKTIDQVTIPKKIIYLVRAELCLLLCVPLCAVFMARGFGYF